MKYVFEYGLSFREADGCVIGTIRANSIFNKKVTLFGSVGTDIIISTDLFCQYKNDSNTLDSDPFILVEAKAVSLDSNLRYKRGRCDDLEGLSSGPNQVEVTIGLFTIVKLFRIVQLAVETKGFCIPPECQEHNPPDACEFFENQAFPMDIFAPPRKADFASGISGNIPANPSEEKSCGCDK